MRQRANSTVLGLGIPVPDTVAPRRKRGLWMAAKNVSISDAQELAPEALGRALTSGDVPPPQVWRNVPKLPKSLSVHRRALWA